jgi:hypothetical protein
MTSKKLLFLFTITIASVTMLFPAQGPDDQNAQNQNGPAAPNNPDDELKAAKKKYWESKTQLDQETYELQKRVQSFRGQTEQAIARESVALAFRKADAGIGLCTDELRKKLGLLTNEEIITEKILDASLEDKRLGNELTKSTNETKKAEQEFLESQTLVQKIMAAKELCSSIPGGINNPACIKRLTELAKEAGIELTSAA